MIKFMSTSTDSSYVPLVLEDGSQEWRQGGVAEGVLHRVDGPAKIWADGRKEWWVHGAIHREAGAAIELADGGREWYDNHQLHRLGGTAIDHADGTRKWYERNQLHRMDGPAVELADGRRSWWLRGLRHREDGPAVEGRGLPEYWLRGELASSEEARRIAMECALRDLELPTPEKVTF